MASAELQHSEISEKMTETSPASFLNKNSEDTTNKKNQKKKPRLFKRKTEDGKSISLRVHLDLKLLEPLKLPTKLRRLIEKRRAPETKSSKKEVDKMKEENSSPQRVEELSHKLEEAKLKESSQK